MSNLSPEMKMALEGGPISTYWSGDDGRDSLGYVPDDGIETLPPNLPLPNPDRTGIERGPATRVV